MFLLKKGYNINPAVFWGDKRQALSLQDIKQAVYSLELQHVLSCFSGKNMIILDQRHSSIGYSVDKTFFSENSISLYEHAGDFLVTDLKRCVLVVLTADCVPLVLFDKKKEVVGIVHAGWRGSLQGVVLCALQTMQQKHQSDLIDIEVSFGAGAKSCCYEVNIEFYKNFEVYEYAQKAFVKRNNKLYFDNKHFLWLQLQTIGIKRENIYDKQAMCTICSLDHCSFRREKENAGRQMTVVSLM